MDAGAVLLVIVLLFVLPPLFLMGGGVVSAILGWAAKTYAEKKDPNSELIDLNY